MIGNSSFKVGIYIRLSRDDGNIGVQGVQTR